MVSYSSGGDSSPKKVRNWNKEQRVLFRAFAPKIMEGLDKGGTNYPKSMFVPELPEEQAYFSKSTELAQQLADYRTRIGQPAYEINPETTEQFYQKGMRDPTLREWRDTTLPTIEEQYSGPGYWGSARADAVSKSLEDVNADLAAQRATLYYGDEQARRTSLESAMARDAQFGAPAIAQEAEITGSAAQYARAIAQEEVMADMQRWLMGGEVDGQKADEYNPFMALALSALGLSPFSVASSTEGSSSYGIGSSK